MFVVKREIFYYARIKILINFYSTGLIPCSAIALGAFIGNVFSIIPFSFETGGR